MIYNIGTRLREEKEKMKKYNLRNIMKNAWSIRRSAKVDMRTALKAAWAIEKAMMAAEEAGKNSGWNYKRSIFKGYVDNMTGEFFAA